MAQQDINSATVATTITGSDSVFISKNDNALQKIDYDLLVKAIIEQYTGSTLGGSAQSVKSAIDTLNSNLVFNSVTLSQSGKSTVEYLDSLKAGCIVQAHTWAKLSDMPSEFTSGLMSVIFITDKVNRNYDYVIVNKNGDQWLAYPSDAAPGSRTLTWVKQPTRAEMTALEARVSALENS